jgi:hypothetical protein
MRAFFFCSSVFGCPNIAKRGSAHEKEILQKLATMDIEEYPGGTGEPVKIWRKPRRPKSGGQEPIRQALYLMSGVDVTQIDAIGVEPSKGY